MTPIPRYKPPVTAAACLRALPPRPGAPSGYEAFARQFARYIGVTHAIPAPSAREALAAVLHALQLPPGGEVIMPSLTFHSMPATFRRFGLRLRFVDIDPATYCLDPARLEAAIGPATAAIAPVHLYGRAAGMEAITAAADRHGLVVIEDCAQSCGARVGGRRAGSLGRAGVFSFHPAKNISALWAGMVTTSSDALAARVTEYLARLPTMGHLELAKRFVQSLGMSLVTHDAVWGALMAPSLGLAARLGFDPIEWLTSERAGMSTGPDREAQRMPRPLQGRIALGQLARLDEANALRIRNAERLRERLDGAPGIELPGPAPRGENIYLSFVARVEARDEFRRRLLRRGVDTHPGNMFVGPELPGLAGTGDGARAADAVRRMVHLPVYGQMTVDAVDGVADAVLAVLAARRRSMTR